MKTIMIITDVFAVWICCIILYIRHYRLEKINRELSRQLNQLNRFIHKAKKVEIGFFIESEQDCDEYAKDIAAKNIANQIVNDIVFEKRKDIYTEQTYYKANVSYLIESPYSREANK